MFNVEFTLTVLAFVLWVMKPGFLTPSTMGLKLKSSDNFPCRQLELFPALHGLSRQPTALSSHPGLLPVPRAGGHSVPSTLGLMLPVAVSLFFFSPTGHVDTTLLARAE